MVVVLDVRGAAFRGFELCGAQLDFQVVAASENVMVFFIKRFTRSNFSADLERMVFPSLICLSCASGIANLILCVIHCLASVRSFLLYLFGFACACRCYIQMVCSGLRAWLCRSWIVSIKRRVASHGGWCFALSRVESLF